MKFIIRRRRRGLLRRRQLECAVVFSNGKAFAVTEGYNNLGDLEESISVVKREASDAPIKKQL